MKIVGNGHERDIIYHWELTDSERQEFDYATEESMFFRYKGDLHCMDDFVWTGHSHYGSPEMAKLGLDGFASDTYFSGIGIKLTEDNEHVKVYLVFA